MIRSRLKAVSVGSQKGKNVRKELLSQTNMNWVKRKPTVLSTRLEQTKEIKIAKTLQ